MDKFDLDLSKVSENHRLAFYGALFAIASVDGNIEKEDIEFIFSIMNLKNFSESGKSLAQSYLINPPNFEDCLNKLLNADQELHFALMMYLIDKFAHQKQEYIKLAQFHFKVSPKQIKAMEEFVQKTKQIDKMSKIPKIKNKQVAEELKIAVAGLAAVGVPICAIGFSGSVIGFSAAGITSGLAGLGSMVGLGGMIPGLGVTILLGVGIFMGVKELFRGGKTKKRKKKVKFVIDNIQGAIYQIIDRIEFLQKAGTNSEANRKQILILTDKMKKSQEIIGEFQKLIKHLSSK